MIFLLLLFSFSLFANTIDIYSEKTVYKDKVILFSEGFSLKEDEKTITAKNGHLKYPLLTLEDEVNCHIDTRTLSSDQGFFNLKTEIAEFTSNSFVTIKDNDLLLYCKKAIVTKEKNLELVDQAKIDFSNATISSDHISVFSLDNGILIRGIFEGEYSNSAISFFYNGDMIYDKENKVLQTKDNPFFVSDQTYALQAAKAEFFLGDKGLEKINLSETVQIVSEKVKALCDSALVFPKEKRYLLKGKSNNPVLLWQEGALLSCKEVSITQDHDNSPEIETKGVVHLSVSDQEKKRFKQLLEK